MDAAAILIAISTMALAATGIVHLVLAHSREGLTDALERRRVLVHTLEGSSFEGVLTHVDRHELVLADASSLDTDDPTPLGGEQWIARDRIKFVQVVSPR